MIEREERERISSACKSLIQLFLLPQLSLRHLLSITNPEIIANARFRKSVVLHSFLALSQFPLDGTVGFFTLQVFTFIIFLLTACQADQKLRYTIFDV